MTTTRALPTAWAPSKPPARKVPLACLGVRPVARCLPISMTCADTPHRPISQERNGRNKTPPGFTP